MGKRGIEMVKGNENIKKPIFKKWWFWAIVVVVVLAAIGSQVEKYTESVPASKEEAESNDLKIYTAVKLAGKYLATLSEQSSGLEDGSFTALDMLSLIHI